MHCRCGCGKITSISRQDQPTGVKKGEHMLFIKGHGGGMARRRESVTPDLWTETDLGYSTPCWIWNKQSKNRRWGHCTVWISGKEYGAHRAVYEHYRGAIPEGLEIDHLCKNSKCVNPDHLEPVTHAENMRRSALAKLTWEKVSFIRSSEKSVFELSEQFDVSCQAIEDVRSGKTWA